MDFGIVKTLQAEWAALTAAPWSFVTIAAIALGVGFTVASMYYGGTVATLRERVQFFQDRLQGVSPDQVKNAVAAQKDAEATAKKPLIEVAGKYFANERVQLDGRRFIRCKFENVTLVYNGGPFEFLQNELRGFIITSDIDAINSAVKVLHDLGLLKIPVANDGVIRAPSNPIHEGNS
jgi:hypothetical protein